MRPGGLEPHSLTEAELASMGQFWTLEALSCLSNGHCTAIARETPCNHGTLSAREMTRIGPESSTTREQPETRDALPPELARVVSAWPQLPLHIRATIDTLVSNSEKPAHG